ncbi:hypothetical protein Ancab_021677 [Ancistrocladus abbreviatus]
MRRLDVARILISTEYPGIIAQTVEATINKQKFSLRISEEISGATMEVSGMDSSSSKIKTGPDKTDSGLPDASAAMDSVSRVPNSPEEIHRVWSEKHEHRCGETHAFSKACGNRLTAKTPRDDSCQDKLESPMSENDQRVQRVLRGKAKHSETAECCRYAGGQTSQKEDGTSEDMPLRLLLHRQKKLRKKCLLTNVPSTQSAEDEGQGLREASVGPNSVGPTSPEKGNGCKWGARAHYTRELSAQGVVASRGLSSKQRILSQTRFFTLPRNRQKLSMLQGGEETQWRKIRREDLGN